MKETVQQTKQRYALYGAQYKVDALQQEIDKIMKAFPDLSVGVPIVSAVPAKKVRNWTKAQKAEASKRAKAFWAKRRKG